MDEKLMETLKKKALGYTASEQVTEYNADGSEVKQKVTTKDIQPDLAAMKMLIELTAEEEMTEAELEEERRKLMCLLAEYFKDNEK